MGSRRWYSQLCIELSFSLGLALAQAPPSPALATDATPDSAEQKRLLAIIGQYTEDYVSSLPNFLCDQVIRHFEASRYSERWRKEDVFTSKLVYAAGQERRTLELVNGKPVKPGMRAPRAHLVTEGEFGKLMANLFTVETDASFTWRGWDSVHGKRVAVFDYSVDKEHSTLSLSLSSGVTATLPYHGAIFADPETGAVWRIVDSPTDFPFELKTQSLTTDIDYSEAVIGGKKYLLPSHAVVTTDITSGRMKNEMDFQDYRKFEAESTITFQPEETPKTPGTGPPE